MYSEFDTVNTWIAAIFLILMQRKCFSVKGKNLGLGSMRRQAFRFLNVNFFLNSLPTSFFYLPSHVNIDIISFPQKCHGIERPQYAICDRVIAVVGSNPRPKCTFYVTKVQNIQAVIERNGRIHRSIQIYISGNNDCQDFLILCMYFTTFFFTLLFKQYGFVQNMYSY